MRFVHLSGAALSLLVMAERSSAQSQPATIPTVVAQAMAVERDMFGLGAPRYFAGRPPTDWPVALIPPGAKILGGGVVGDTAVLHMQTAVFAFPTQSNPHAVVQAMLTRAGYVRHELESARPVGGFVESPHSTTPSAYCKGSLLAVIRGMDSVQSPGLMAIHLIDGEAGRENCTPQSDQMMSARPHVTLPMLSPPMGATSHGSGTSWGGSVGSAESQLQTTMPTDSVLAHYTAQLVAAGWKSEGKPAVVDGVGVQRFSFRVGQEDWTGALIVMAAGDRRQVQLHYTKTRPD